MPRMIPLAQFDPPALEALIASWGHKPSHARKVLRAFYDADGSPDLDALEIGTALRGRLRELGVAGSSVRSARRATDGTTKLLVGLRDGAAVEAVLMPGHREGRAACCVSSQVGCAMGCDFCA